jgi:hypothetical protein
VEKNEEEKEWNAGWKPVKGLKYPCDRTCSVRRPDLSSGTSDHTCPVKGPDLSVRKRIFRLGIGYEKS